MHEGWYRTNGGVRRWNKVGFKRTDCRYEIRTGKASMRKINAKVSLATILMVAPYPRGHSNLAQEIEPSLIKSIRKNNPEHKRTNQ
jgi:hypothetical protein